jgi:hypothetical protein
MGGLVREPSPEEQALQQKLAELADLNVRLAERERELSVFQAELQTFKQLYLQMVGIRIQELQRIQAQIEEYSALLPDPSLQPSSDLKQIYRQLAKSIHPDFANDPEERERRETLMAEVNKAYEREDLARLRALLEDWSHCPESICGEDLSAELKRTELRIAQSQQRLTNIERQILTLEQTDEHQLQVRAKQAEAAGRDHLSEKAQMLDLKIQAAQRKLNDLKTQAG